VASGGSPESLQERKLHFASCQRSLTTTAARLPGRQLRLSSPHERGKELGGRDFNAEPAAVGQAKRALRAPIHQRDPREARASSSGVASSANFSARTVSCSLVDIRRNCYQILDQIIHRGPVLRLRCYSYSGQSEGVAEFFNGTGSLIDRMRCVRASTHESGVSQVGSGRLP